MKRKYIVGFVLVLSVFIISCGVQKSGNSEIKKDGVLNIGAIGAFKNSKEGGTLVFDTLTRIDHNYHALPSLIRSWTPNKNYTEYNLEIRDDVSFHDGTKLNSEIVKWNIEKGGVIYYASYSFVLESIDIIDETHLKVKFSEPNLSFQSDLALIPCIPINGYTQEGKFATHVGTGAYRFEGTDSGGVTTLIRNEKYWDADFKTDVNKILWHVIPDEQTRKLALESGKVDVIGLSEHYISMPYSVINELKKNNRFEIIRENEDSYTSVGSLVPNWKNGVCADKNIRLALTSMFDRKTLVKNIFFGIPKACGHVYNPKFDDGPKNQKAFEYSEENTKRYLENAGYIIGNANKPTVNAKGEPLKLKIICGDEEYEKDLLLYIADVMKKWGIETIATSLDVAQRMKTLAAGDYDIHIRHPWFVPLIGSIGYMGFSRDHSEYGIGLCINDEMFEASSGYLKATTEEEAKNYAAKIWEIQYNNAVTIPLFADLRYIIHNKKFKNFHFDGSVFKIDLNGVVYR
ncbi:MAG: ABC transporter substrate-binding protein [Treponema phagedenis]|uniref:ABC transporter substrate-binding protein n=1 Tax=Treponema phagedenis TaxID=162 RepID=UPI003133F1DF